jgi:hypothetical protein
LKPAWTKFWLPASASTATAATAAAAVAPATAMAIAALLLLASCGGSPTSNTASKPADAPAAQPAAPPAPAIPQAIQDAADGALGQETEVLVFGDLALNGNQQVLAINRLKKTASHDMPGTSVARAVVVENDDDHWKQVFLCDEHLKNPKGFLGGTPLAPVTGWRLQYEQHPDTGLVMYFTPVQKPAAGYITTIGVRWNPKNKRYQSLDRTFQTFVGETPELETPRMELQQ